MATPSRTNRIERLDEANVSSYFGINTFGWRTMQERLPRETLRALKKTLKKGERLSPEVANAVAQSMKAWALEHGATHFTHWFQPMTGLTAEKHDAFIAWDEQGISVIESFSGDQLIQGEPDASSFPSGGLRATFEARGYTAWDPNSPAFLMEGPLGKTLCIPTAFIGYHGEALDHKVPLLRSMEYVATHARAALRFFEVDTGNVIAHCGPEQEYFLIDKRYYMLRPDLMFAGRTVQGARPPKGQELEDHYFGSIKPRVLRFMQDLEVELYKLGIPAKTRHNEVAPNQFEIAPIHEPANVASDHNQLLMEMMKQVADRHGLAVLFNEKPFAGVNGSGKHNNWSLCTDEGHNLLDPGHTPAENLQFLYFLCATLRALHRHGALLRASIASASNDHRLGANEAPPAIMSVFLGEQLNRILDQIERGEAADASEKKILDLGISKLPVLNKDATDRNRTSPFAFTGNKFEFRAVGASQPIAVPLMVLNVSVGEALQQMNAQVESLRKSGKDVRAAVMQVIRTTIAETRAIRFDGNNYSKEWRAEAERRGLPHARNTVEALRAWELPQTRELFSRSGVLTREELDARIHVRHEQYVKTLNIEAQVLREMGETMILPAVWQDVRNKAETLEKIGDRPALRKALDAEVEMLGRAYTRLEELKTALSQAEATEGLQQQTEAFGGKVLDAMTAFRDTLDALEEMCDARLWPLPKYREMLAPL
ncbi:MAG: glutamine synthetase III [Myxococcales bacterium]|nr:glutamine synthetase III [Myxococcota bacterium]MDW8282301.1 glutamine synthetase III [Myxococcales bacterium]